MKQRTINQLNMAGTIITLATSDVYLPVYTGKPPVAFGTDFAKFQTAYLATMQKAALADGAAGGGGLAKAAAETDLENQGYVLTRALANFFKNAGDLVNLGKCDLAKRDLVRLTGQELIAKGTEIRDLGTATVALAGATDRGVTTDRITAVTNAIGAYAKLLNVPRNEIVDRSTLIKEVETDTAGLLVQLADLDDLVLQFDGTSLGQRFIAAWHNARTIVDAGHGPGTGEKPAPVPAPTPAAPAKP
jgi:hypothetical protein